MNIYFSNLAKMSKKYDNLLTKCNITKKDLKNRKKQDKIYNG